MPKKTGRKNIRKAEPKKPMPNGKKAVLLARVRGMRDILPEDQKYWELAMEKARKLAADYGFKRIETPILEKIELYEKSSGQTSDIVTKEMYSFVDKGGEKLALRPEATPGIVRAYTENGMFNQPQPMKLFWIGPLFRHDRPQAGRYRQHTQFDMEIFGEESPLADVQLILIAYNFFRELQIEIEVQINSIGCDDCRRVYREKLLSFYKERGKKSKLCPDCRKRLVKNPLRLLDCKEPKCVEIRADVPQAVDFLCEGCRNHFVKVLEYLDELNVAYSLNPTLVRGLDYYNRTVFEIWPKNSEDDASAEARQSSLCGGGRYDKLVENMGGRPTPAFGFGLGMERVIAKIKESNIPLKKEVDNIIFIAQLGEQARRKAFVLFEELRRVGFNVRQEFTKDSLKAQLETANRIGAKMCLILGQKEILDGTILIRDMESGIQEVVDYNKIRLEIEKRIEESDKPSA